MEMKPEDEEGFTLRLDIFPENFVMGGTYTEVGTFLYG